MLRHEKRCPRDVKRSSLKNNISYTMGLNQCRKQSFLKKPKKLFNNRIEKTMEPVIKGKGMQKENSCVGQHEEKCSEKEISSILYTFGKTSKECVEGMSGCQVLYKQVGILVKNAYSILTFCQVQIEKSAVSDPLCQDITISLALFYSAWKNFLESFEEIKQEMCSCSLIPYIATFVKVAILVVLEMDPFSFPNELFHTHPTRIDILSEFFKNVDLFLKKLLGSTFQDIHTILSDVTSETRVRNLIQFLKVDITSDSLTCMIPTSEELCLKKEASVPILSSCEWGFLDLYCIPKTSPLASKLHSLPKETQIHIMPGSFLNLKNEKNLCKIEWNQNPFFLKLIETPYRFSLCEMMTVDLKSSTKHFLPLKAKQSVKLNTLLPSSMFPSCELHIKQHGQMFIETMKSFASRQQIPLRSNFFIILTGRKTRKNMCIEDDSNSNSLEWILLHITLTFPFPHSNSFCPSIFSLFFSSIIRFSPSLQNKQRSYSLFLMKARRHLYTLKFNAVKAARQVYGKNSLDKIVNVLVLFDDLYKVLNTAQIFCDWYLRLCAFHEVFWCPSSPFTPLMTGDIQGYTWSEEDPCILMFQKTLHELLQCLTQETLPEEYESVIPSFQRSKLIFFLSETLNRSPHTWNLLPLDEKLSIQPVWTFDNVQVRILPSCDPRKRLRGQFGLFATEKIANKQIIGPYVGRVYSEKYDTALRQTVPLLRTYIASREQYEMSLGENFAIDSCTSGNRMNFVNDYRLAPDVSFLNCKKRCNCTIQSIFSIANGPEIPVFCASRDILPDEEILTDYGESYWSPENPATTHPYFYGAQDVNNFLNHSKNMWSTIHETMEHGPLT